MQQNTDKSQNCNGTASVDTKPVERKHSFRREASWRNKSKKAVCTALAE